MEQALAETFKMYKPEGYCQQPRKILYIGKATAGDLKPEQVADVFEHKDSAFWRFARQISDLAGGARSNLAWSNIFKQGVLSGNPAKEVAEAQRDQSVAML